MGDIQNIYYFLAAGAIIFGVLGKVLHGYFENKIDRAHKRLDSHDEKLTNHDLSISELNVKAAVTTQRFGFLEDLLTEMRSDIKQLLSRRPEE